MYKNFNTPKFIIYFQWLKFKVLSTLIRYFYFAMVFKIVVVRGIMLFLNVGNFDKLLLLLLLQRNLFKLMVQFWFKLSSNHKLLGGILKN